MGESGPEPWPVRARNAWLGGVILGYAVAALTLLSAPPPWMIFALAAVAPTLALLAYPRRPALLLPAGAIAVASLYLLSIYGVPMVVIGIVWLWAQNQVSGATPSGAGWSVIVGLALWIGAAVVVTIHVDPSCTQTLSDGTVQSVDPALRGYPTGWIWEVDSSSLSGSSTSAADVGSESCVSDTIVWWESVIAIAFASASVLFSWLLTEPTDVGKREPSEVSA